VVLLADTEIGQNNLELFLLIAAGAGFLESIHFRDFW
jgi:hypothetical protein